MARAPSASAAMARRRATTGRVRWRQPSAEPGPAAQVAARDRHTPRSPPAERPCRAEAGRQDVWTRWGPARSRTTYPPRSRPGARCPPRSRPAHGGRADPDATRASGGGFGALRQRGRRRPPGAGREPHQPQENGPPDQQRRRGIGHTLDDPERRAGQRPGAAAVDHVSTAAADRPQERPIVKV